MRKLSAPLGGLADVQNYCINYAIIMHTHRHENWEGVISTLYTMSYDVMGITQASVQGGSSHERLITPTLITQR